MISATGIGSVLVVHTRGSQGSGTLWSPAKPTQPTSARASAD